MEKISTTQQEQLEKTVKPSEQPATESPVLFCRECGTRLRPDAAFCSECGTPIVVLPQPKEAAPQPVKQMQQEPNQGVFYTPARRPEPISIDLHDKSLSPSLRRAFLFAEDGDWERADEYLEKVLDDDPENAYAYLGKLLVELQVEELEGLAQKVDEVKNSRNYKRALRYSDEKLKKYLTSISSETELQNDSEQAAPTVSEEAKMRSLFPDDYDLLLRFWAGLYFIKETSREANLPEKIVKQLENGLWDGMRRNYGTAAVDQAKRFIATVDENRLAVELNVLERMNNGDETFSMQWRDGEKPTVAIDISELE